MERQTVFALLLVWVLGCTLGGIALILTSQQLLMGIGIILIIVGLVSLMGLFSVGMG